MAKRVFLERGFHAASMDLIAARAGVSKITVYAHYSDKATLFGAIIEDIAGQLTREIDQLAIAGLPPEQALRRVGATYLRLTLAPQSLALYRLLVAEAAHYPKLGRLIHQSGPRPIVATLARYLESRRELRIGDTLLAAEQFLGMVLGHRQLGLLLDALPKAATRADIDKVVDHAVNLFLYGCGA
ncbi:MAG TPA: TetR/AcrR family transcriptional regulator [Ferrovibrio sp.]|uniref:TetR/AcrR family transcriptional regulator n=1 Tax=Ferrovibrio sp. TaxID=1917215 RepID=UPI002ED525E5